MKKLEISKNYQRKGTPEYQPSLVLRYDGTATLCMRNSRMCSAEEREGREIVFDVNYLSPQIVETLLDEHGYSWIPENIEEYEQKVINTFWFQEKIKNERASIHFWEIYNCPRDIILEDQTVIKNWKDLKWEQIQLIADQLEEKLPTYDDDYSFFISDRGDILSYLERIYWVHNDPTIYSE